MATKCTQTYGIMVPGKWWAELCIFWNISVSEFPVADLCLMFWNFVDTSTSSLPSSFGIATTYIYLLFGTFWNTLGTKGENRLPKLKPKPRMNFSTQAKQIWARNSERCSSAAFPSDYITSQGVGMYLPSSRAQQPLSHLAALSASAAKQQISIPVECCVM